MQNSMSCFLQIPPSPSFSVTDVTWLCGTFLPTYNRILVPFLRVSNTMRVMFVKSFLESFKTHQPGCVVASATKRGASASDHGPGWTHLFAAISDVLVLPSVVVRAAAVFGTFMALDQICVFSWRTRQTGLR